MEEKMFATIMPILVGGLVNKIIDETCISEDEAFQRLYNSKLYEVLENEKTKVWTYSISMLFDLYLAEVTTGSLELPEY